MAFGASPLPRAPMRSVSVSDVPVTARPHPIVHETVTDAARHKTSLPERSRQDPLAKSYIVGLNRRKAPS